MSRPELREWQVVAHQTLRGDQPRVVASFASFVAARHGAIARLRARRDGSAMVVGKRGQPPQWAGALPGWEVGPWAPRGLEVQVVQPDQTPEERRASMTVVQGEG